MTPKIRLAAGWRLLTHGLFAWLIFSGAVTAAKRLRGRKEGMMNAAPVPQGTMESQTRSTTSWSSKVRVRRNVRCNGTPSAGPLHRLLQWMRGKSGSDCKSIEAEIQLADSNPATLRYCGDRSQPHSLHGHDPSGSPKISPQDTADLLDYLDQQWEYLGAKLKAASRRRPSPVVGTPPATGPNPSECQRMDSSSNFPANV